MKTTIFRITKNIFNRRNNIKSINPKQVCYIIGNGPSLQKQNLTLLKNSCNIVCNNFVLFKEINEVKIDFYCISDPKFIHDKKLFQSLIDVESLFSHNTDMKKIYPVRFLFNFRFLLNLLYKNTFFININPEKKIWETGNINFDINNDLFWGHTIILDICIPLAVSLGFKEIRLLGCDTNYISNQTHFYGTKSENDYNDIDKNRASWYDIVNKGYYVADREASKKNIDIYDCTLNGKIKTLKKKRLKFLE